MKRLRSRWRCWRGRHNYSAGMQFRLRCRACGRYWDGHSKWTKIP